MVYTDLLWRARAFRLCGMAIEGARLSASRFHGLRTEAASDILTTSL